MSTAVRDLETARFSLNQELVIHSSKRIRVFREEIMITARWDARRYSKWFWKNGSIGVCVVGRVVENQN